MYFRPAAHGSSTRRTAEYWPASHHIISDAIYERSPETKAISTVASCSSTNPGQKERRHQGALALMDQDGANVRYLTGAMTSCSRRAFVLGRYHYLMS